MAFEVLKTEGRARRARLTLAHGVVETPVFMPVGTYGAVKAMMPSELKALDTQILLGNTYHLYLRPGLEVMGGAGGLHRFMGWDRPILTDSGGFQVFSLGKLKTLTDEGVQFRSHLNGDLVSLTPEKCAEIQKVIGSDIAMVLDECVALPNKPEVIARAVQRSRDWAERFLRVERLEGQKIFGIVQGGTDLELRRLSLDATVSLPVDGVAIGGLSVGETHREMVTVLEGLSAYLPPQLPHYLMGVGTPRDLLEAVHCGVDMFDCVLPTRNARNASLFTDEGLINLRNLKYKDDHRVIDPDSEVEELRTFTRSYLRHLFQIKEILACRLATLHNLNYYHRLMFRMRKAIESGTFEAFYQEWKPKFAAAYPDRSERLENGVS